LHNLQAFASVQADVVVIDTSNYYPQFGVQIAEVDAGMTESVWKMEQLGYPGGQDVKCSTRPYLDGQWPTRW
jgi:hypothetical protein